MERSPSLPHPASRKMRDGKACDTVIYVLFNQQHTATTYTVNTIDYTRQTPFHDVYAWVRMKA